MFGNPVTSQKSLPSPLAFPGAECSSETLPCRRWQRGILDLPPFCVSLQSAILEALVYEGLVERCAEGAGPEHLFCNLLKVTPRPPFISHLWLKGLACPQSPESPARVLYGPRDFLGPSPAPRYQLSNLPKHRHTAARDENCMLIDETLGKITWF